MRIVTVDDEPMVHSSLRRALRSCRRQLEHVAAYGVDDGMRAIVDTAPDLVFIDLKLSTAPDDRRGREIIRGARQAGSRALLVVVSGVMDLRSRSEALEDGAHAFIAKPPCSERLRDAIAAADERARALAVAEEVGLVGTSAAIHELRDRVARFAPFDETVLVTGETGTGKELVARALHDSSSRRRAPYHAVNCGAVADALVDAEIFGCEPGAFTGAVRRAGWLERARDGTLFLDEVGELSMTAQVKLLRVLEERVFERLGGSRSIPLAARIVAATHVDLGAAVAAGRFRADLFERLRQLELRVPALRERGAVDIVPLVTTIARRRGCEVHFADDAVPWMSAYHWPGNVRELGNVVAASAALQGGREATLDAALLSRVVRAEVARERSADAPGVARTLPERMKELEQTLIARALAASGGNQIRAASALGITRQSLQRRLAKRPSGRRGTNEEHLDEPRVVDNDE